MKNWSMRIFTLISLLLISSLAFADNSTAADAVANHTDVSISYLSQIFGTVGNSLQGFSGQMLGMLFYKFNQGILVVAGIWLSYLVFTTFLKSAHEGSFISPNRNIVIILLRVALGFGLLLPNPVTGYSIFQDILMKVVISGVSLADQTWSYGLQYISDGGQVWTDPATQNGGNAILTLDQAQKILGPSKFGTSPSFSNLSAGQKIFIEEVCMYRAGGLSSSVIQDDKNGYFLFPGANQSTVNSCGTAAWYNQGSNTAVLSYAKQGATALVNDMLPAAKSFVCSTNPTTTGCGGQNTDVSAEIGNDFFNSMLAYANATLPATATMGTSQEVSRAFIAQAQKDGWMMAGRYYWDLSQAVSSFQTGTDVSTYVPTVIPGPLLPSAPGVTPPNASVASSVSSALTYIPGYTASAMTLLNNYSGATSAGNSVVQANAVFSDGQTMSNMPGAVAVLLFPYEDGLAGIVDNFSTPQYGFSYDPIVFLHNIGMRCLSLAGAIWIATSLIVMTMSAITIICQSFLNLDSIVQEVIAWMKPFLMTMALIFLAVGIMLGYYVPLYPYMIFTFAVIGWLIRVLVGMAAAPLVCLSLTHPEGHDFLGIAQQLLQLLLSLFIEPVLMVIGLFAGMILSYVSLRILVYTFSGFISDLFWQYAPAQGASSPDLLYSGIMAGSDFAAQNLGGPSLVYLTFPIMLILFAGIVYVVTNKCFSVIFELPGGVMQWIGGPSLQSTAGQMADAVGGMVGKASQSLGQGMNASYGSDASKGGVNAGAKNIKSLHSKAKGKSDSTIDINDNGQ